MDAAFQKTILIVVLFAVFLGLANYYQYKVAGGSSGRRRRRRRGAVLPEEGEPAAEELPPPARVFMGRWSIWASAIALLLCGLALLLMWMATVQGGLGAP
ncbi:MAG: hypothetical protein P1V51_01845 [Deltaproteobacteria bacterium]|nr:hypothetical protein [Deltaproteobacteria bacterium]